MLSDQSSKITKIKQVQSNLEIRSNLNNRLDCVVIPIQFERKTTRKYDLTSCQVVSIVHN